MKILARELWNEPARFISAIKAIATAAFIVGIAAVSKDGITEATVFQAGAALGLWVPEFKAIKSRVRPIKARRPTNRR